MPIIKKFSDGSILEIDRGNFDDWCIYLTRPTIRRHAPKDIHYFERLKELATKHRATKIYNDFVSIYDATNKEIEEKTFGLIENIAIEYENDSLEVSILFTILYLGMIAEENRVNTRLGKRIKRLGMHQIMIENHNSENAANFSKGMKWHQIDAICKEKGF